MEYKTRFYTHVIVGYSMHKIQAAAPFLAFATRLLNGGAGDPSRPPYKNYERHRTKIVAGF